ncbi:MAG: hypothetical protein MZW92_74440 [Comamonadaceae bacterium]|nr:hypothetical protein [Comamonadaceae bacterium]
MGQGLNTKMAQVAGRRVWVFPSSMVRVTASRHAEGAQRQRHSRVAAVPTSTARPSTTPASSCARGWRQSRQASGL